LSVAVRPLSLLLYETIITHACPSCQPLEPSAVLINGNGQNPSRWCRISGQTQLRQVAGKQMQRLTGSTLLAHHKAFHYTKAEKVREAGYIGLKQDGSERLQFTAYYEEVLKIMNWQKRQDLMADRGGADCIKTMLFYAENRVSYKKNNDEVFILGANNLVSFRHHGKTIATYSAITNRVRLFKPSILSKSTKERMNRILMRFCGCQMYQRAKVWYVFNPMEGDIPFEDSMIVETLPSYSSLFTM
jgi:hypothetical protein